MIEFSNETVAGYCVICSRFVQNADVFAKAIDFANNHALIWFQQTCNRHSSRYLLQENEY